MQQLYEGKTKTVFDLGTGCLLFRFKDTVTGQSDGTEDPGGNQVIGEKLGVAEATIAMSAHYFTLLTEAGINNHYAFSNLKKKEMAVDEAKLIGNGIEFVKRYRATGSLLRRYPGLFHEGQPVNITEFTLKDDAMGDPLIVPSALISANLLQPADVEQIEDLFERACEFIKNDLAALGLELWDIKLEIGLCQNDAGDYQWAIIDEVGPGIMRVYQNGKKLDKLDLAKIVINSGS